MGTPGKARVAFVCTHNACRSQIAEAVCRLRASDVIEPCSAGTDPVDAPNADALRLLEGIGADVSALRSKPLAEVGAPDVVVTMGCGVSCPALPCSHREDWGLEDPTGKGDEAFAACLAEIERRVDDLAARVRSARALPDVAALRALADERRLAILEAVAERPGVCACNLLDEFEMSQSTLSHHMKVLCEAGLVSCARRGKWTDYTLDASGFEAVAAYASRMARKAAETSNEGVATDCCQR